jgi:hypothetical protein
MVFDFKRMFFRHFLPHMPISNPMFAVCSYLGYSQ